MFSSSARGASVAVNPESSGWRGSSALRAGAVGGLAAGVMAAAFAAPSTSMFFNSPFVALHAGKAMTSAFLVSAVAISFVALNVAAFSSKLLTSGYAFSFVSHALGPKAGFVSAWMTLLGRVSHVDRV